MSSYICAMRHSGIISSKVQEARTGGENAERAPLAVSPETILPNQELRVPFELAQPYFKEWWFCRFLFWHEVATGRGGWMKTEMIEHICNQLGLDYNRERQALYLAVGDELLARNEHGVYHFKSIEKIAQQKGLRITAQKGGKTKIQTCCTVVFMSQSLIRMNSKKFRGILAASVIKMQSEYGAKHSQMGKRYRKQLREHGYWENWKTDAKGVRYVTKGTIEELRGLLYCFKNNHGVKIPLPEEVIASSGIKDHNLTTSNTKQKTPTNKDVEASNGISSTRGTTESCVTPAQHLALAFCAARFTCTDTTETETIEKGYYTKILSKDPLSPSCIRMSPARVTVGRIKKKPWSKRPDRIEKRYKKFNFRIWDARKEPEFPVNTFEAQHEYHIYERVLSNRNIAKVLGCSPTTVMNLARQGFGGTTAARKTVTVFGLWNKPLADILNEELRSLPLALQNMVVPMKTEDVRHLIAKKDTTVLQLGLTGFADYDANGVVLMVMRSKTCFSYMEKRKLTSKSLETFEKSGIHSKKGNFGDTPLKVEKPFGKGNPF